MCSRFILYHRFSVAKRRCGSSPKSLKYLRPSISSIGLRPPCPGYLTVTHRLAWTRDARSSWATVHTSLWSRIRSHRMSPMSLLLICPRLRPTALLPAWHVCASMQAPVPPDWPQITSHVCSDNLYIVLYWSVGYLVPRPTQIVLCLFVCQVGHCVQVYCQQILPAFHPPCICSLFPSDRLPPVYMIQYGDLCASSCLRREVVWDPVCPAFHTFHHPPPCLCTDPTPCLCVDCVPALLVLSTPSARSRFAPLCCVIPCSTLLTSVLSS